MKSQTKARLMISLVHRFSVDFSVLRAVNSLHLIHVLRGLIGIHFSGTGTTAANKHTVPELEESESAVRDFWLGARVHGDYYRAGLIFVVLFSGFGGFFGRVPAGSQFPTLVQLCPERFNN